MSGISLPRDWVGGAAGIRAVHGQVGVVVRAAAYGDYYRLGGC